MSTRRTALAVAVVVAALSLSACTGGPPAATPTHSVSAATPTPTPTPTVAALQVGPGQKPPVAFGQDCTLALTADDLDDITGIALEPVAAESVGSIGNVGGLGCVWKTDAAAFTLDVLPKAAIGQAQFPDDLVAQYFQDCNAQWVCSWRSETGTLWLSGSFQGIPGMTRESVDTWGQQISDTVAANAVAHPDEQWTRDTTGWWPVLDCNEFGTALAVETGLPIAAAATGYVSSPRPGFVLADVATNASRCIFTTEGRDAALVSISAAAGQAWSVPPTLGDEPVDTGVDEVDAYVDAQYQSGYFAGYTLTDGVNMLSAEVAIGASTPAQDLVQALARVMAHDLG